MYIGKNKSSPCASPFEPRRAFFIALFQTLFTVFRLSFRYPDFSGIFPVVFPISRFSGSFRFFFQISRFFRIIPVFRFFFPISRFSPDHSGFSFRYPVLPDHSGFSFRYLDFPRIIPVFLFKVLLVPPGGVRPAHRSRGRSYPRGRVHLPFWGQRPDKKELYGTGFSNGNPAPPEHIH